MPWKRYEEGISGVASKSPQNPKGGSFLLEMVDSYNIQILDSDSILKAEVWIPNYDSLQTASTGSEDENINKKANTKILKGGKKHRLIKEMMQSGGKT